MGVNCTSLHLKPLELENWRKHLFTYEWLHHQQLAAVWAPKQLMGRAALAA